MRFSLEVTRINPNYQKKLQIRIFPIGDIIDRDNLPLIYRGHHYDSRNYEYCSQ